MGRPARRLEVVALAGAALLLGGALAPASRPPRPAAAAGAAGASDALSVFAGDAWRAWWRADSAPKRWPGELPLVRDAVAWHGEGPGVEWGELRLSGPGEAWRLRVILARLDPRLLELRLAAKMGPDRVAGPWSVAAAPAAAAVALNAGQFGESGPWGWIVHRGRELRAPGAGPLAMAFVVDTLGGVRLVSADDIAAVRARGGIAEAFQSYPALLVNDGEIPAAAREEGLGVDLRHRDSRLAVGALRDGRLLVALTRFEGLGGTLSELPFGPTVPESAALMGALGCRQAVLLDGGISGQMLVRDAAGATHEWRALRRVPLGLVALRRGR